MSGKIEIQKMYALTPMQEGMLFHRLLDESSSAYFEQMAFTIIGELDTELLEKCVNIMVERYDIFRTIFICEEVQKPVQVVLKERILEVYRADISNMGKNEQEQYIEEFRVRDREQGFDLTRDMLLRISVISLGAEQYKVIWSHHHIIMDGWCMGLVIKELFEIYSTHRQGAALKLKRVYPFSNYIKWLERQDKAEALDYWQEYLEEYDHHTGLPKSSLKQGNEGTGIHRDFFFSLDGALTEGLTKVAKENRTTLNTLFQAIWGILLNKYNNTEDAVFGAVVSGRPPDIMGVEDMIGLFINTIPVRIRLTEGKTFSQLVQDIQGHAVQSEKYDYMPLAEIQAKSKMKQGLIDHILVFENLPVEKQMEGSIAGGDLGFTFGSIEAFEQTSFDFNIIVGMGSELGVKLNYNTEIYDEAFISSIEGHFKNIARQIVQNTDICICDLDILTEDEKTRIMGNFNNTEAPYSSAMTLHGIFEGQSEKHPQNTALIYSGGSMTYREVNERANQLARRLVALGVKRESIVGIMTERSPEMIIAIMAILKAGGAYLPIDPEYPPERVEYILEDSEAHLLLTKAAHRGKAEFHGEIIDLDDETNYKGDSSNLRERNKPTGLAYIIYTSGSTGRPKGVMIEHTSAVNILSDLQGEYPLGENDVYLMKTTYTFDVSVSELFGWFFEGGRLAILEPGAEKEPREILNAISKFGVTHINFVPSMLNAFLCMLDREALNQASCLKYVFAAGEAISRELTEKFYSLTEGIRLENIYGPTEATIYAVSYPVGKAELGPNIPIGKPMKNVKAYIVDKCGKLLPVGVPGELCIGGVGLARGYLNRPELTVDKFVPNPYAEGQRLYKTGDLSRWLPDGNIEYLGRIDHQVKIRGFRIELGEIEAVLAGHEHVKHPLVIAREDSQGNKFLCAYYIGEEELSVAELKEYLAKALPEYMIPSHFIRLDEYPMVSSGKIDRNILPVPKGILNTGVEYTPPENEVEEKLVKLWQQILNIEQIGTSDNFFNLGGHSLNILTLVHKVYQEFGIELHLRELYSAPTIKEFAQHIVKASILKEYHRLIPEKSMTLLNGKQETGINIFAFPPIGSYGAAYKELASRIDNCAFYAFDFVEEENRYEAYRELITDTQEKGSYILLGYSAGGNLAFELAREMQQMGLKVSDIILLDSHVKKYEDGMTEDEIKQKAAHGVESLVNSRAEFGQALEIPFIRAAVTGKMESYLRYISSLINTGQISAEIHYIKTLDEFDVEEDIRDREKLWEKMTTGKVNVHNGFGDHPSMLEAAFVDKNAEVIKCIVENIKKQI